MPLVDIQHQENSRLGDRPNRAFANDLLGPYPLDSVIEWVESHLEPCDVFSRARLLAWANAQPEFQTMAPQRRDG